MGSVVIEQLTSAVDAVCGTDAAALGDGETLLQLLRQRNRLDAAITRAAASFDASGEWQCSGARSAAGWLAIRARLPRRDTHRLIAQGRPLRDMPATEEAWLAGDISEAHVGVLGRARP